MKIEANTIEELFDSVSTQKEDMIALDAYIVSCVPQLKRQLFKGSSITMVGYGEMSWKSSKDSGVWPLISVAPQKNYISIFIAAEKEGVPLPLYYKETLGKNNNGKHCIRVKKFEHLNLEVFKALIEDALVWHETEENKYGRNCARPVKN